MQLKAEFFCRDVKKVACELLGSQLCFLGENNQIMRSTITETEAYDGEDDLACHASKGRTPRTSVMYHQGGVWYVYLCYGVHWMLNAVVGKQGYPAAVLIRGTSDHCGPGRLTKAMGVNGSLNGKRISKKSGLWIESSSELKSEIVSGPRIGVNYAGPVWSQKPYRFWFSKSTVMK